MSINGKRDNFTGEDFRVIGRSVGISNVDVIVDQVVDAVSRWPQFAREVELNEQRIQNRSWTSVDRVRYRALGWLMLSFRAESR